MYNNYKNSITKIANSICLYFTSIYRLRVYSLPHLSTEIKIINLVGNLFYNKSNIEQESSELAEYILAIIRLDK